MNNKLEIYDHQVSGKAPKFTDKQSKFIYKTYSQQQAKFYQYLKSKDTTHRSYGLRKFIPQFFGLYTQNQILQHQLQQNKNNISQCDLFIQKNDPSKIQELQEQQSKQGQKDIKTKREEWVSHINSRLQIQQNQLFLKLKNLTSGLKYPNIIDIKLGIKKHFKNKDKLKDSTTFSHKFRINGLSVKQFDKNQEGDQKFMSKYYCQKINASQMAKHLAFFFFNGKQIQVNLLKKIIFQLKQMILGFRSFLGLKFMSSSIFIAYDAFDPQKYTINFIDFDKYQNCLNLDQGVQEGMINTLHFLNQIILHKTELTKILEQKDIRFQKQIQSVVPDHAMKKYNKKLDKSQNVQI